MTSAKHKLVKNYPKPGILLRNITSLLENSHAYAASIASLVDRYRDPGQTKIVGIEARGFVRHASRADVETEVRAAA